MARRLALAALAALVAAPSGAAARPGQVVAVEHVDATPTLGRADALVTIDLYFVPGAEPSHAAYRAVRDLAQRHPARVRARFWPRTMGARQGTPALALAAHRVGKFFAYMDALAASSPPLGPADSLALAVELGLDRDAAARAAREMSVAAAQLLNALYTPLTARMHVRDLMGLFSQLFVAVDGTGARLPPDLEGHTARYAAMATSEGGTIAAAEELASTARVNPAVMP